MGRKGGGEITVGKAGTNLSSIHVGNLDGTNAFLG